MKAGWEVKPLGEVARTTAGGTPKKSNREFYEGGSIPWLVSGEVANSNITEAKNFITEAGLKSSSAKIYPRDSVLIAMYGATASEVGILRFEACSNQAVCAVLPNPEYLPEYLYYCLLNLQSKLAEQAIGNAQPNISQSKIKALEIPIPPLEEQKRIVAVLDAAFEGLTRAKENAETNLQNARDLFESHLTSVFRTDDGTLRSTLGDAVSILTGYAFKSAEYSEDPNDMAMVRGDNILQGQFRWKNVKRWPAAKCHDFEKFRLSSNDVLLAMDRTWVKDGIKYAIVSDADLPLLLVQRVARLRCLDNLNNEYLGHFIGSKKFEQYVLSIQTGMGVPHISGQQIKDCPISLPDISVQNRLAEELSAIRSKIEALEANYRTKLADITNLRQSLLQKAFAGELT